MITGSRSSTTDDLEGPDLGCESREIDNVAPVSGLLSVHLLCLLSVLFFRSARAPERQPRFSFPYSPPCYILIGYISVLQLRPNFLSPRSRRTRRYVVSPMCAATSKVVAQDASGAAKEAAHQVS